MRNAPRLELKIALTVLMLTSMGCRQNIFNDHKNNDFENFFETSLLSDSEMASEEERYAEFWKIASKITTPSLISKVQLENRLIKALDYIESRNVPVPPSALFVLNDMLYQSDYDRAAIKLSYLTLGRTEGTDLFETRVKAAATLTYHFEFQRQNDSLEYYLGLIEDVLQLHEDAWIRVVYHSVKANLEDLRGNYFDAAVNNHAAIEYIDPKNYDHLSTLYHNLATMYLHMAYPERALSYILKSLQYKAWRELTTNDLNSLAVILVKAGHYDQAEIIYTRLKGRALKSGNPIELAMTYSNTGNLKRRQKQYSSSLKYFALSDSICAEVGMDFGLMVNGINKGETYLLSGKYIDALRTLKKAEEQMASYTIPSIEIELFRLLSEAYEALGEQTLSDRYFRRYSNLKKNHIGDYPRSMIKEWENQKERLAHTVSRNLYEQQLLKETNEKYLIALISFAGLTLGLFLFLVRERKNHTIREKISREKQAIAYELEIRSKELLADTLKRIHLAAYSEEVLTEIRSAIREMPESHKSKFEPVMKTLKSKTSPTLFENFDSRLNSVHESFYAYLREVSPDLTSGELRLCGMIRVGMSSKEISMLTNRTVRTIENARSSIRKKLRLSGDDNLQKFLEDVSIR